MKKKIFFALAILLGLTACGSSEKAEEDPYDNPSFYDYSHGMAETEDGYYFLNQGFLSYTDKESLSTVLVSENKYSLDDLLSNPSLKEETDNYFSPDANIYSAGDKLYITDYSGIYKVDPKKLTRDKVFDYKSTVKETFYKGTFYYVDQGVNPEKGKELCTLYKYRPGDKDREEVCDLNQALKFEKPFVDRMYSYKDKLFLTCNDEESYDRKLFIYDLKSNKSKAYSIKKEVDGRPYYAGMMYFLGDKLYFNCTYDDDDSYYKEKTRIFESDLEKFDMKETESLPPLYRNISNGKEVYRLPMWIVASSKDPDPPSYIHEDFDSKNFAYKIGSPDGKEMTLDDKYFRHQDYFDQRVSSSGDLILRYESGDFIIIRDGKVLEPKY